jgi:hypothetical protein
MTTAVHLHAPKGTQATAATPRTIAGEAPREETTVPRQEVTCR